MVQVVCAGHREVVPAVHARRLYQLCGEEQRKGQDVRVHDHHGEHDGDGVREQVLHGVRVLRGEGHGRRELVVLLVDAGVDLGVVQGAVRGVEGDLAQGEGDGVVGRHLAEGRELGADGEEGVLEVLQVEEGEVDGLRGDGPDQDVPDAFSDGCPRGLASLALELVAVGEGGEGEVDGEIDGADQPEADQLAEYGYPELDQTWRIVVDDLGPLPFEVEIKHIWGLYPGGGVARNLTGDVEYRGVSKYHKNIISSSLYIPLYGLWGT